MSLPENARKTLAALLDGTPPDAYGLALAWLLSSERWTYAGEIVEVLDLVRSLDTLDRATVIIRRSGEDRRGVPLGVFVETAEPSARRVERIRERRLPST